MSDIAAQAGVSVIPPPGVTELVDVDLRDVPAEIAFRRIAEQVELRPVYADGVVSFVSRADDVEAFTILPTGYVAADDAVQTFQTVMGTDGKALAVDGRLMVVGTAEAVERAVEAAEALNHGPDGWLLQVSVVEVSETLQRDLGLTWTLNARGRVRGDAGVGNISGLVPVFGAGASLAVEAIGRAEESGVHARTLTVGSMFLLEGLEAELQLGDVVPIPARTVSPEGVVTTTAYERIKTGFNLLARGRRVPEGILLEVRPEVSAVAGFVGDVPIVQERSVSSSAVLRSGEWMILSGLDGASLSEDSRGVPGLPGSLLWGGKGVDGSRRSTLVLIRAVRVYASGAAAEGVS